MAKKYSINKLNSTVMADTQNFRSDRDVKVGQLFLYEGAAATAEGGNPAAPDSIFAFATSAELTINTNMIDTSNKMDGDWESSLPGKKNYSISCNALCTDKAGMLSADGHIKKQIESKPFKFWFGSVTKTEDEDGNLTFAKDTTKPYYTGIVNITSSTLTSEAGDLVKYQTQMQGTGALKQNASA